MKNKLINLEVIDENDNIIASIQLKRCSKCGEVKRMDEFGKEKNQCKECEKEYREKNKEKIKKSNKEHYNKNKVRINEYHKYWQRKNKEKINKNHQIQRKQNPKSDREYNWRKKNIDIVHEQYLLMLEQQNNHCLISNIKFVEGKNNKHLCCVDHDPRYLKNNVRGLLCTIINLGLEKFKDDKKIIEKAISYIQKNNFENLNINIIECKCKSGGFLKYGRYVKQMLYEKQNGKCLICDCELIKEICGKICLDHNHHSGLVRGLLCNNCNTGLGFFEENISYMNNAIQYLKFWEEKVKLRTIYI